MNFSRASVFDPPRRGLPGRFALLATLVVVFGWAAAAGDYSKSFQEGMKALDRKRWAEVARFMQEAMDQNPEEGESLRLYGVRFEVYLPHYYLGLAQYHLGDCPAATAAWEVSEGQGAVSEKQLREVESMRQECQLQLPSARPSPPPPPTLPSPPPPPEVDQKALDEASKRALAVLDRASLVQTEVLGLERDPSFAEVFAKTPELKVERASAAEQLEKARSRLASDRRDLADLEEARRLASQTEELLRGIARRANDLRDELQREVLDAEDRRRQQLQADLALRMTEARRIIDRAPENLDGDAGDRRTALDRLIAELEAIDPSAGGGELKDGLARLDRGVRAFEQALANRVVPPPTAAVDIDQKFEGPSEPQIRPEPPPSSGPPAKLRSAAEAFFEARYDRALTLLGNSRFRGSKAQATGYLLSAAARYSLFLEGASRDEVLRDEALSDILLCRQLDAEVKPHPAMFSPPFRQFFDSAR